MPRTHFSATQRERREEWRRDDWVASCLSSYLQTYALSLASMWHCSENIHTCIGNLSLQDNVANYQFLLSVSLKVKDAEKSSLTTSGVPQVPTLYFGNALQPMSYLCAYLWQYSGYNFAHWRLDRKILSRNVANIVLQFGINTSVLSGCNIYRQRGHINEGGDASICVASAQRFSLFRYR